MIGFCLHVFRMPYDGHDLSCKLIDANKASIPFASPIWTNIRNFLQFIIFVLLMWKYIFSRQRSLMTVIALIMQDNTVIHIYQRYG